MKEYRSYTEALRQRKVISGIGDIRFLTPLSYPQFAVAIGGVPALWMTRGWWNWIIPGTWIVPELGVALFGPYLVAQTLAWIPDEGRNPFGQLLSWAICVIPKPEQVAAMWGRRRRTVYARVLFRPGRDR